MVAMRIVILAFTLGLLAAGAKAQDLRIGLAAEPSAMDPHYHNLAPNNSILTHVFERLIEPDEKQRLMPGLAESWKPIDDTVWEFKLRKGVTWHDGTPVHRRRRGVHLRARAATCPTAPRASPPPSRARPSPRSTTTPCTSPRAPWRRRCPTSSSTIMIVSKKHGEGATTPGLQLRQGRDRHRPLQARQVHAGRPHRARPQRCLLGPEVQVGEADVPADPSRARARRRAARGRSST